MARSDGEAADEALVEVASAEEEEADKGCEQLGVLPVIETGRRTAALPPPPPSPSPPASAPEPDAPAALSISSPQAARLPLPDNVEPPPPPLTLPPPPPVATAAPPAVPPRDRSSPSTATGSISEPGRPRPPGVTARAPPGGGQHIGRELGRRRMA